MTFDRGNEITNTSNVLTITHEFNKKTILLMLLQLGKGVQMKNVMLESECIFLKALYLLKYCKLELTQ